MSSFYCWMPVYSWKNTQNETDWLGQGRNRAVVLSLGLTAGILSGSAIPSGRVAQLAEQETLNL